MNLSSSSQSTEEVGGCSGRERLLLARAGSAVGELSLYVNPIALKPLAFLRFSSSIVQTNSL